MNNVLLLERGSLMKLKKKAIEKGYQILKIYEVWHFKNVAQYDPITKSGGIFIIIHL